ncbi:hypothetical protein OEZ85_008277 [Tetradesmus obliquus]|uniref:Uncharacterized protein n=1 Tax=Tetradesmus obliquus TaxID=3088 RepID=A0ABY8TKM7_TETOB|nr:hypothetical protein OEZ85_008277 [Tetradesmus obliquus]
MIGSLQSPCAAATVAALRALLRTQPNLQQQQPLATNSSKSVQDRLGGVSQRLESLVQFLTPKQEGDIGDVLMMSLSMAVLIFFSMQLYRLYAYAYFHAGSYQTMMDMMQ